MGQLLYDGEQDVRSRKSTKCKKLLTVILRFVNLASKRRGADGNTQGLCPSVREEIERLRELSRYAQQITDAPVTEREEAAEFVTQAIADCEDAIHAINGAAP